MDADRRVEMQMDVLEALADAWAEEVDLTAMITNATSPMKLHRSAPSDVRDRFHDRMKSQLFAIAQQAFIEGAYRGVMLVNDELRALSAREK